jgi:hypothetical protein
VARLTRGLAAGVAAVVASVALASCGGGTNTDAVAACKGVRIALREWDRSLHAPSEAARRADVRAVEHQVALVVAVAAMANSQDGSYDALMTQLQQAEEESFGTVAPALRASCDAISSQSYG